jgi:hypothetical protein
MLTPRVMRDIARRLREECGQISAALGFSGEVQQEPLRAPATARKRPAAARASGRKISSGAHPVRGREIRRA